MPYKNREVYLAKQREYAARRRAAKRRANPANSAAKKSVPRHNPAVTPVRVTPARVTPLAITPRTVTPAVPARKSKEARPAAAAPVGGLLGILVAVGAAFSGKPPLAATVPNQRGANRRSVASPMPAHASPETASTLRQTSAPRRCCYCQGTGYSSPGTPCRCPAGARVPLWTFSRAIKR